MKTHQNMRSRNKIDIVAERRKKLAEIRHKLNIQTPEEPFSISQKMSCGLIISDFVAELAISIHKKRTYKKPIL